MIYVNQTGEQDELVFDDTSSVINKQGDMTIELKSFATDSIQFNHEEINNGSINEKTSNRLKDLYD